jgi:hypothetical protein
MAVQQGAAALLTPHMLEVLTASAVARVVLPRRGLIDSWQSWVKPGSATIGPVLL